jgi:iron complex transport system ATP-binding protein
VSAPVVISLQNVTVRRGASTLLDNITWTTREGERWAVLGPNGAGKTTLLQLCAALMHPSSGTVSLMDATMGAVDVFDLRSRIGFSSAAMADRIPADETVQDVVLTAAYAVTGRWRERYDLGDKARVAILLRQLGMEGYAKRTFGTLSEGERKRVQIARALMPDPEVLLLDEPAAGLDLAGREDLLSRITDISHDPYAPAMVLVTHHLEEIPSGFTHALLLRAGNVVAQGPIESVLDSSTASAAFGLALTVERLDGRWFARARR